jgi:hypothetical protein
VLFAEVWNALTWTEAGGWAAPSSSDIAVFTPIIRLVIWLCGLILIFFLGTWLESMIEAWRNRRT